MKNILRFLLLSLIAVNLSWAQTSKGKIVNEPVTPHGLKTLGLTATTNSVSPGLDIVAVGTYVYLSPKSIGTAAKTGATFTLTTKPAGSAATLTTFNGDWVYFKADVAGQYVVGLNLTTASGSHDTTKTITAGTWVGVGNFEGVAGNFPKCMTCHASNPKFSAIFDKWKVSGHATRFKKELDFGDHYSTNCMKCHTTGYDHNAVANNGGFDDVAATLGWSFNGSNPGSWDSLKAEKPGLVNLATIGCESCHGAGSNHATTGAKAAIQVSLDAGVCAQCHDEPWRHNVYAQYENSMHAEALWSSSFAQGASSQNNSLGNCIRCHDGQGFVNFTKGLTTNTTGWTAANLTHITCATCHDPHTGTSTEEGGMEAALRTIPAASDTLANGFKVDRGGEGRLCMSCHKARKNVETLATNPGTMSSHWGNHHSVQGDVLLGQTAATFPAAGITSYASSSHSYAIQNSCVDCHMYATVDTGNVNRDKVGGHSFKMHNDSTGYDNTRACQSCHGPKNSFEDFEAISDYDKDGNIEAFQAEVEGLISVVARLLPPQGVDSIDYTKISTETQRRAYLNWQLISFDHSKGMHNPKFAVDVLTKSATQLGWNVPVQLTSFTGVAKGNVVTLSWETSTETNNKGFEVEKKSGNNWVKIGFVNGKGTTTEVVKYNFSDKVTATSDAKLTYRIKQVDFDGTISYSKAIEVEFVSIKSYSLSQNYPNPFNPSTKINYTLPFDSQVKVVIYNLNGEVVKELVNRNQAAGSYDVVFNSSELGQLTSGIYFYSIDAKATGSSASFKQTKKMVLIK